MPRKHMSIHQKKFNIEIYADNDNKGNVIFLENNDKIKEIIENDKIIKLVESESKNYKFNCINWGYSKGDTYSDICVILTGRYENLKEENNIQYNSSINKIYVALTRTKGNLYIIQKSKFDCIKPNYKKEYRKLKNEKYNIAATMDKDELEAIKNRKKIFEEEEQEELQELIDTITSHELREELDESQEGSLLADLMATSSLDEITSSQNLPKDTESLIEETAPLKKAKTGKLTQDMDDSFYTRSLDLSDKDFEMDDELGEELKESKKMLIVKLIFLLLLLVVVVVGSYFIIKSFQKNRSFFLVD